MTGITLCLIVKNEARYVESCIRSVLGVVEDVVVVDTGSTDNTIEICRKYTPNVHEFPFNNNFSEARNYAMSLAKTKWILFLDADEEFEPNEAVKLPVIVQSAPDDVFAFKVFRYNFFATGGWYSGRNVKLIRNDSRIQFRKKVNESVDGSIADIGMRVESAPVVLNHYGHWRTRAERDAKSIKYTTLMGEQLQETPDDAIVMGYIGLIARTLGRFEEALQRTETALKMNPNSATLHSFRGHVLRSVDQNEEARLAYQEAVRLRPTDAAAWNMIGVTQLTSHQFDEAIESFDKALLLEPVAIHALINKGLAFEATGDFAEAYKLFDSVAGQNRGFLRQSWLGKVECDPYRSFYYETIMQFSGLAYHLAYSQMKLGNPSLT